ncbi:alpha/beta hydrolase [uncultured Megasphaera sp.]|uniref:alpha/beta hydrolase n=1 Tax=uncultured Megasphaera sp. TaxID=165188 RepID=UPI0025D30C5B|nr:alpha/beta fold hydrolase [uncultured Megasphaera sp.]
MMFQLNVPTKRGVVLNGVLFRSQKERRSDTVMIAITGIHGNFYSNPFYYNIGDTLNSGDIDFIYAQTNNAFSEIPTVNVHTGKEETIGSWNERFAYTDDDLDAYITFAQKEGYKHIILGGHSLGANKVIYYLSRNHDKRVEHFFLLSPANLTYMMSGVTNREKEWIKEQVERGDGDKMLPFLFMGWVTCIANTAWDWQFSGLLNNVHTAKDGDFSQASALSHTGALLVGTYDNFTDGDPSDFLRNLNNHMPTAAANSLIFIEKTGHTYQMKHQEVADKILAQLQEWRAA